MAKVAINGLGRIGRAVFKIIQDNPDLELVAVNDLVPPENLAYLLNYDTVYGRSKTKVESDENSLIIDGKHYKVVSERDPAQLPWGSLGIDLVFECTGLFTNKEALEKHLQAGAKSVILSAPTKSEGVETVVYGVNHVPESSEIFSCASCTTNCISPVVEVMGRRIGIKKAILTTIHAYTATQAIVDGPSKKLVREGRAAGANFVPSTTGAAIATTKVLPQYKGKFDGVAVRGPIPVGSISDIIFVTERPTTVEEINTIFREEAESDRYKGIMSASDEEIV
ncbi:type I glyceraldehyde-3-phosphate dehydrogenase, partial [Allocoleopsis sp.]|uniref:type I glyceraldehyde-3-phosphate dehydrogenase n=1 Tax=Allocoleopsis sp. TaxID=3088169 RepID=UPI002FD54D2F